MSLQPAPVPHRNGEALVLAILFIALLLSVGFGYLLAPQPDAGETLSVHTSGPAGAQALQLWLNDLGYPTTNIEYTNRFRIPPNTRLLFLMAPPVALSDNDVDAIATWVEAGGVLVLVDEAAPFYTQPLQALRDRLQVSIHLSGSAGAFVPEQPLLTRPPVRQIEATVYSTLVLSRSDYINYLVPANSGENNVTLVSFQLGMGRVYYSNLVEVFANDTIAKADNAELILNMLADLPQGSQIAFDEYHHGFLSERDLRSFFYETPWGWSLLYAGLLLFLYIALNGRRFGHALPLSRALGRSTAEYVISMAALFRRAHKRRYIQTHYYQELKRTLARKYTVNPKLDNTQFATELTRRTAIDEQQLVSILNRLERADLDEDQLVAAAREADTIIKQAERRAGAA